MMTPTTARLARRAAAFFAGALILSCKEAPTAPHDAQLTDGATANVVSTSVVISQVYAGAASSGPVYKQKFVELFNRGSSTVNLSGWSLQYASATGTGNFSGQSPLALVGSVAPGKYFLVQVGTGGSTGLDIPTPDQTSASGLNPAAGAGKLIVANTTTGLACNGSSTVCSPAQLAQIIDLVGYGNANFFEDGGAAPAPSATLAIFRKLSGCQDTDANQTDFATGAPAPRNSATAAHPCGPAVSVSPATASVGVTGTQPFTASEVDAAGNSVGGVTFAWTSADNNIATIDGTTGVATGLHAGTVTITATDAAHSLSGTAQLTVTSTPAVVTVTPNPAAVFFAGTQQFTASAVDAGGNPVTTTFTWSSSVTGIATIDPATGFATADATAGSTTIKAIAANGASGTATLNVNPPLVSHSGEIVISQIYGGGGNAGATYKNDFIELFNRSTHSVDVTGWSVQRNSAGSTTGAWDVTPITGTIPAGGYYLVQEAAGAGGTLDLPTPDATGTGAMGATNGKVALSQTATAFAVACPSGVVVVDIASYGANTNCGNSAPAPSNTTADLRKHGGCQYTPDPSLDFSVGAPTPRNSASPARSCVPGPLDHVTVSGPSAVLAGSTIQLTAEALDANDNTVLATLSWTTSDGAIATVNNSGLVTGVAAGGTPATITVSALAGGITRSASTDISVGNPGGLNWIDLSSSTTSFPPGYQTQLFGTGREQQNGTVIDSVHFTFQALDAYTSIQMVGNTAIVTAVSVPPAGTKAAIKVTGTPYFPPGPSYSFTAHPFTIENPVTASASLYGNNDAFGDPTPGPTGSTTDFIIRRSQYVLSYNQPRGTPNWVSYELDSRQFGSEDRCNCFTADPLLPASAQVFTSDYTGGGYDRGHMTRSSDRTVANVDNANTFYLTNVVPQMGDLNQGVWNNFEQMLHDSATAGRAVYIVTGPLFTSTLHYLNNAGKVAIPDFTWKVALIGPRTAGVPFDHVTNWSDLAGLTLLAVNMPNVAGIRNDPPSKYFTTVEAIEEATGYDLLALLNAGFTTALEHNDHAPVPHFSFSGTQSEGSTLTFDATASTDPDIGRTDVLFGRTEALTCSWHFSDGADAAGCVTTHTFSDNGNFTATLTVTDVFGWPATASSAVAVSNVAPTAAFSAPASVNESSPFTLQLTGASDPSSVDLASLTYAFDCGDGAGYGAPSSSTSVSCPTSVHETRSVRGRVMDKDGGSTEYTGTVSVANVSPSVSALAGATLIVGETYSATGSFTDPGLDTWAATVNYGDDGGSGALPLTGKNFSLTHTYATAGTFTVTVVVADGGSAIGTSTASVLVRTSSGAVQALIDAVNALGADGTLRSQDVNPLIAKLNAAIQQIDHGNANAAGNQLDAFVNQLNALVSSGRLPAAVAEDLIAMVARIKTSLGA